MMMQTVGITERILTTLRELIEHHSSSRTVAEQMGQAHNYVARILRGETKLRLDVLERILETLGVPHRLFMQMVLSGAPSESDAVALLGFLAGSEEPAEPFLNDVRPTLDVLLRMPLVDDEDYPRQTAELDRLERLRRSDKEGAEAGLKALVFELLTDPPVPVPRQMLEDLAVALATFGTVQRYIGRHLDAFCSFQAAFQVGARAQRPAGLAHTYRKAAFLICEHGQPSVAVQYLEHARELFLRVGDTRRCYEIFLDRAWAWVQCGEIGKAIDDYQAAASFLPDDEPIQLFSAYAGLAYCYQEQGDIPAAFEATEKAEALQTGDADLSLAFLVWNRAKLAAELGETALARRQFQRAISLLIQYSDPIDGALCALDLCSLLIKNGEAAAVRELSEQMLRWLPAFRGHRVADAVMAELIRCAKWGEVTTHFLDGARERLEKTRI
ncbi:MAG: helix-turn-helix domain-containing protein [Acidobacteriota bacterium]